MRLKPTNCLPVYENALSQQKSWVAKAQASQKTPGVLLLIGHAGGKPLIAGKDTAGDWMVQQAGGKNLATHTGYKPFSVESLAGLARMYWYSLTVPSQVMRPVRRCSKRILFWRRRQPPRVDVYLSWTRHCWWRARAAPAAKPGEVVRRVISGPG